MIRLPKLVAFALVLCLCFTAIPFSGEAADSEEPFILTGDEREYLDSIRDDAVVLGITGTLLSFDDIDGNPAGMLLPVINLLKNEFGLTVTTRIIEWGDAFNQLDAGTIDMFGLAILSDTRLDKYLATNNLFTSGLDIYTRINEPLGSLMNLDNKDIACVENSVLPQILLKYMTPTTTVRYYSDIDEMFASLENGDIDCVFTSLPVQADLLNHPTIHYETRVTTVQTPQCLYSGNPELEGLINIINRYINSASGNRLLSDIEESRVDSILKAARIHFAGDIDYIRNNYQHLRIYDSGVLYPLAYFENGEYKGLQRDINDIFSRLTGMPIEVCPPSDFENGLISAFGMLQEGELVAATGVQLSNVYSRNTSFVFSRPVTMDNLHIYSLVGNTKELTKLKIGTTSSAMSYVDWSTIVDRPPAVYASNDLLMGALKRKEVDAVFFGEMNADYYYTVQKDYTLERVGNVQVDTAYYIMMEKRNESFNKVFSECIKLQRVLYPDGDEILTKASIEDKFAFMRLQSRISGYQNMIMAAGAVLFLTLIIFLYVLWYQYRKFSTYDRQIALMLTTQKNADMIWGNVATGKLVSKGNFPIYRDWGLNNYTDMTLSDAFIAEGFLDDVKSDIQQINENELAYNVAEKSLSSQYNGSEHYVRRYTHKISEDEFVVFLLDITDEKKREADLAELANTDPLSKLKNRRSMQEILRHKAAWLLLSSSRLFIVMLDVDNFKKVNDSYGHEIGDNVLIGIAKTFKEVVPECIASRWGGEEFLFLLEAESLEDAVATVERIREEISRKVFPVGTRTSFSVTVSCGLSELLPGKDVQSTVALADEAMYTAKHSGKNCVKIKCVENV